MRLHLEFEDSWPIPTVYNCIQLPTIQKATRNNGSGPNFESNFSYCNCQCQLEVAKLEANIMYAVVQVGCWNHGLSLSDESSNFRVKLPVKCNLVGPGLALAV